MTLSKTKHKAVFSTLDSYKFIFFAKTKVLWQNITNQIITNTGYKVSSFKLIS